MIAHEAYFSSLSIFLTYTIVIAIIFGILPSLSDSYYALKHKWNLGGVFQVVLALSSLLISFSLYETLEGYWFQFLGFLTATPLLFVAAAPEFNSPTGKKSLEAGVHGKSAILSGVMSLFLMIQLAVSVDPVFWKILAIGIVLNSLGFLFNLLFKNDKNWLYWAEYTCFFWIYAAQGWLIFNKV